MQENVETPSLMNNPTTPPETPDVDAPVEEPKVQVPDAPEPEKFDGPEWLASIDDPDLKQAASLKKFNDIKSLAKSYIHAEKSIGKNKIVVPDEHASDDDWAQVFKSLGVPDNPDDYKIEVNKDLIVEEEIPVLKDLVAKSGLLPKQAQKLIDNYQEYLKEQVTKQQDSLNTRMEEGKAQLKKDWGEAFERKAKEAETAFAAVCDDKDWEYIESLGLNNDPQFVKMFSKIYDKYLSEGKVRGPDQVSTTDTPEEAQTKINDILANTEHPYYDKKHPNHAAAVQEVQRLYAKLGS